MAIMLEKANTVNDGFGPNDFRPNGEKGSVRKDL